MGIGRIVAVGLVLLCMGCKRKPASPTDAPDPDLRDDRPAQTEQLEQTESRQDTAPTDDAGNVLYVDGAVTLVRRTGDADDVSGEVSEVLDAPDSLSLTDTQVEELRRKLRLIRFPVLQSTTASILGLPESKSHVEGFMWCTVIPLNDEWECAGHIQRWWVLNSRYRLLLAEGHYLNCGKPSLILETRAGIVEDTSGEAGPSKWRLSSPGTLSAEAVRRAEYGSVLNE